MSSLLVAGKVYAVTDQGGTREVKITRVGCTPAMNETLAGVDAQGSPDPAYDVANFGRAR